MSGPSLRGGRSHGADRGAGSLDEPAEPAPPPPGRRRPVLVEVLFGLALLTVAAILLPVEDLLLDFGRIVRALGPTGLPVYALAHVAAAVLFVPVTPLTMASGWLFGPFWGAVVASLSSTTASALSFAIGRRLLRGPIEERVGRSPRLGALSAAIGAEGWKLVLLLRLSPLIPFGLGNLFYGTTPLRFRDYVLASFVGMLPGTILYTMLGAAGRRILHGAASPVEVAYLSIGIAATFVAVVWTSRVARRELRARGAA